MLPPSFFIPNNSYVNTIYMQTYLRSSVFVVEYLFEKHKLILIASPLKY